MEAMRRRLMERDMGSQKAEPSDVISISSSSSSGESDDSSPVVLQHPRKQRKAVIISSDDESEDEDEAVKEPINVQADNSARSAAPAKYPPIVASRNPILYDMPRPEPAPRPNQAPAPSRSPALSEVQRAQPVLAQAEYETFDVPDAAYMYDPQLTPAEAEKALRDLVTGAFAHADLDVDSADAEVEGFRSGIRLLPHQIVGRKWMADRETGKKAGGILADDMGLGKTIQTITRIVDGRATQSDKKDGWSPTTLVVCPVAVVSQWASEIKKIAIGLRVIEHHGPSRTSDPAELSRAHVVITSYSTVQSEHATYSPAKDETKKGKKGAKSTGKSAQDSEASDDDTIGRTLDKAKRKGTGKVPKDALFRVRWLRVVLDEAHNIKNRLTKSAIACCALESKYRWCLTGTPMQNSVEELFSLIKFLNVRPLNDWSTFNEQIAKPVKAGKTARAMKRLHVVLGAIMLRRTKDTLVNGRPILELPDRIVKIVDCKFDSSEQAFYESVNTRVQESLEKLQRQGEMNKNYTSMLVLLLRLRQACNHPLLISEDYRKDSEAIEPKGVKNHDDEDADDLTDQLAGMGIGPIKYCQVCQTELTSRNIAEKDTCTACLSVVSKFKPKPDSDLPPDSAKIRKIVEILKDIEERTEKTEKTIIFSQFTSMLTLIEPFLKAEGIRYVRYDGSMKKEDRETALETIKQSKKTRVILISFKAGSTGLNLTCCNNVILVDLWWNPALEDQAFDRAHRFGQTRTVNIHKLSVPDTVEQRIQALQDKKRELAKAALAGDKMKNMRLRAEELIALFRPGGRYDDDE